MNPSELDNARPSVYEVSQTRPETDADWDEDVEDEVDTREVFDLIRGINDPEHPLTLEQLNVVQLDAIAVDESRKRVDVTFTPTIPHCSMASLIGLCIRVKLQRSLPSSKFKIGISIAEGSHDSEVALNKQLADKERVAAALENAHLMDVVNQCLTERK